MPIDPLMKSKLFNAKEAANYLHISLSTLHRMESHGVLIALRTPGGHRRYTLEMLNSCLKPFATPNNQATRQT